MYKNLFLNSIRTAACGILFISHASSLQAQQMEDARTSANHMHIGWNLGNTLDSNSGDVSNMWIERWSGRTPSDYEKAWGQSITTRNLIKMFKEAGFNAIRVPVTWYPHYGNLSISNLTWNKANWSGYSINAAWMKRVKEIVDYVIDEGMYCILNVHHDTGTSSTSWVLASSESHQQYEERFTTLWTSIANEFKDYGDHLLFEGYNEMTDKYQSWCYASMGAKNNYNATDAADAYKAVNDYAQNFVDAVRATGGNNAQRNLIVNTYAACSGAGSWNSHLLDPLKQMAKPKDTTEGHVIFQVHSYWDVSSYKASTKTDIANMFSNLNKYLAEKHNAPVIIGEWGSDTEESKRGANYATLMDSFATYFVQQATKYNMPTFYWMGLSDGADRAIPQWTEPAIRDAIIKGYYGEGGYVDAIECIRNTQPRQNNASTSSYNLSGQRITPNAKGIVIRNGKKVIQMK